MNSLWWCILFCAFILKTTFSALFDLKEGQVVPETLKWAEANAIITDNVVELKKYKVLNDAMSNARTLYSKNVGMSTFDFDDTLAHTSF